MTFEQLKCEFKRFKNDLRPYTLINGEQIVNGCNYVSSHIETLEAHKGNWRYLPYYNRLLEYYQFIKSNTQ